MRRYESAMTVVASAVCAVLLAGCGVEAVDPTAAGSTGPASTLGTPTSGVPSTTAAGFPVSVMAANGEVAIESRPERIASLSATHTEILFGLDAGDQVVAVDQFSTFPPEAAELEQVDAFELNVEAVASLDPDLVVLAFDPGDAVASFEALGIPTLLFDAPVDLDDAYTQMEVLGAATGHVAEAAEMVAQVESGILEAVSSVPAPAEPVTYYYELDPQLFTVTSETFVGSLFSMFGMENVADPADTVGSGYPQLSPEAVIDADPDLIFLADTLCCDQNAATVAERPGWDVLERGAERRRGGARRRCRLALGPATGRAGGGHRRRSAGASDEGGLTDRPARLSPAALAVTLGVLILAVAAGLLLGPAALPPQAVLAELADHLPFVEVDSGLSPRQAAIVWQLRAPRVLLGGLVGAMLAVAGAGYQGVFRNPLADPYLLGVAAGAGLGATLAIASDAAPALLPPVAFAGAIAAVVLTHLLGRSAGGPATLILAGVAVAAFLTAVQTFVQQRRADSIREVYSWILGRLATLGWGEVAMVLPYVVIGASVIMLSRRALDVLSVGEEEAATLGARPDRIRLWVVAAATLGTAAAVSVTGLIGFVGFVIPHTVRLLFGSSFKVIVPLSLVLGAAFLVLADVAARSVVAPGELPIGVVTALVGAPSLALMLNAGRVRGS